MHSCKVIGGSGNLGLRRLKKLLVTLVDQLRDLTTDEVAGVGEYLDAVTGAFNRRRNVLLLQEGTTLCAGRFQQVKAVVT